MKPPVNTILLLLLLTCISTFTLAQERHSPIEKDNKKERRQHKKEKGRELYEREYEEFEEYDGPDKIAEMEAEKTKDPATGRVPREKLMPAIVSTRQSKIFAPVMRRLFAPSTYQMRSTGSTALNWTERGPTSDIVGSSNGNTRANNGKTAGRIRCMLIDSTADPTKRTVWAGSVSGGLWRTSDITASSPVWTLVNDYLANMAISDICQDPTVPSGDVMYFCTGEAFLNSDAVRGAGVFKSTDHGRTWNQLSSTASFGFCSRILCDYLGNVYLATRGNGIQRSTNGGTSWTNITPSGFTASIGDMEISSTTGPGRLHIAGGFFNTTSYYRYTDSAWAVTSTSWRSPVTSFTSFNNRIELTCLGSLLYALPANASSQVPTIFKSTDGGLNWSATAGQPASGWGNQLAWYCLAASINPANTNEVIVGCLEAYKTTNGGNSWTKISNWVGTSGQYVHADIHEIIWYDGGSKLLFACDGGIHYSSDGGTTIRDRNLGLRIKQFYSCALHPINTNYFLGGTQDNGSHQFNNPGLTTSVEVTGGDGAYAAIDQNQPQNQFTTYIYNNSYNRSTNGGTSWSSIGFYKGTSSSPTPFGGFINVFDYDDSANIIYAGADNGEFFRWTTPLTTSPGDYYSGSTFSSSMRILSGISVFNNSRVLAVKVSPYTSHRVFFGAGPRVIRVDRADTVSGNVSSAVNLSAGTTMAGSVSCINIGNNDQQLIVSYSNYSVSNVWISYNGGTTWTPVDGNLPDMPVRWCMFWPGDSSRAIIATETGIWETAQLNGSSTIWTANPSFPAVRATMIKYRATDRTFLVSTHGRGMYTATLCTTAPGSPSGVDSSRCGAGALTLTATPGAGETIDWYDDPTAGSIEQSGGTSFITPVLTQTRTFYAQSRNITSGCVSNSRTAVIATIKPVPAKPVITARGSTTFCSVNSLRLVSSAVGINTWSTGAVSDSILVSTSGNYFVQATLNGCTSTSDTTTVQVINCNITLNLKLYLQGLYLASGKQRPGLRNSGLTSDSTVSDTITIEFRRRWAPYNLESSTKTILSVNGDASITFPATDSSYYIVIKHRNSLETWSANPIVFSSSITYDFSNAASKAFGSNLASLGSGFFGIYSGDLNQDGVIESADYVTMENDVILMLTGYRISDLNGDGNVNSMDYNLMQNNLPVIIFTSKP